MRCWHCSKSRRCNIRGLDRRTSTAPWQRGHFAPVLINQNLDSTKVASEVASVCIRLGNLQRSDLRIMVRGRWSRVPQPLLHSKGVMVLVRCRAATRWLTVRDGVLRAAGEPEYPSPIPSAGPSLILAITVQGVRYRASSSGTARSIGSNPAAAQHLWVHQGPIEFSLESPECAPVRPLPESEASNYPRQERFETVLQPELATPSQSSKLRHAR